MRLAVVGLVSGALIAGIVSWALLPRQPASSSIARLRMSIGPAVELGGVNLGGRSLTRTAMAFSPDGESLVYAARREGVAQLYVRRMDQYEARPLPGTEGAVNPFFSPEGEWVGFWANGQLKKIPFAGGSPVSLTAASAAPMGATWTEDDTIVYDASTGGGMVGGGLLEVSAMGGDPKALTTLDTENGEISHRLPSMLPERRAVLFTVKKISPGGWDSAKIVVVSLETGESNLLIDGGADARYLPTGHLVYASMGKLMAVAFDIEKLEVTGQPTVILDGVAQAVNSADVDADTGAAQFRVSTSGALAYLPGGIFPEERRHLVWVDRMGGVEPLDAPPRSYWSPRLSPDGRRIALHAYTNMLAQIWLYDALRNTLTLVTPDHVARDTDGVVGRASIPRSLGQRAGDRLAHRPVISQYLLVDPGQFPLQPIRVDDQAAAKPGG